MSIYLETRPNCFVKVDPFREADSRFIIRDPGKNHYSDTLEASRGTWGKCVCGGGDYINPPLSI